jgi:hypothetical protein
VVIVQYTYGLPRHNANDEGLFGFVRVCAKETPTAGLSLLERLLIPVTAADGPSTPPSTLPEKTDDPL